MKKYYIHYIIALANWLLVIATILMLILKIDFSMGLEVFREVVFFYFEISVILQALNFGSFITRYIINKDKLISISLILFILQSIFLIGFCLFYIFVAHLMF